MVLAAVAVAVGVDDNLPGVTCAYLSAVALVLAFVHPWRTPRRFLILTGATILVFVVSVILSNVFEAVGFALGGGVFFIIAVMLCPAALLVGLIGAAVTLVTSRRGHHHAPPARPVT